MDLFQREVETTAGESETTEPAESGPSSMKPFWTAGAYQGGFKQCKRTTGRIFILLATLSAALWPRTGRESRNYACGLLRVDFEQFFDTLRQERLFHKMQTAGIPDHIIMLWKELAIWDQEQKCRLYAAISGVYPECLLAQARSWQLEASLRSPGAFAWLQYPVLQDTEP